MLGWLIGARDESEGLDEGGDTAWGQASFWYVVKGGKVWIMIEKKGNGGDKGASSVHT